jgi:hypothetical protein
VFCADYSAGFCWGLGALEPWNLWVEEVIAYRAKPDGDRRAPRPAQSPRGPFLADSGSGRSNLICLQRSSEFHPAMELAIQLAEDSSIIAQSDRSMKNINMAEPSRPGSWRCKLRTKSLHKCQNHPSHNAGLLLVLHLLSAL